MLQLEEPSWIEGFEQPGELGGAIEAQIYYIGSRSSVSLTIRTRSSSLYRFHRMETRNFLLLSTCAIRVLSHRAATFVFVGDLLLVLSLSGFRLREGATIGGFTPEQSASAAQAECSGMHLL